MKTILFASGNKSKLAQFKFVAKHLNLEINIISAYEKYPELARYNEEYDTSEAIVENGAKEIWNHIKEPIVVEDSVLHVEALNGLPGMRSNEYLVEKGRDGLLDELKDQKNREASMVSCLGYYDGKQMITWKVKLDGYISESEKFKVGEPDWVGPTDNKFGGGFKSIFIPAGIDKTQAELTAEENIIYGDREKTFKLFLLSMESI